MDFPKTIYVGEEKGSGALTMHNTLGDVILCKHCEETIAIYTLKEVKKKVTNVTLEEI